MYLTDLAFLEEGTPNYTEDGLVNFSKMRMVCVPGQMGGTTHSRLNHPASAPAQPVLPVAAQKASSKTMADNMADTNILSPVLPAFRTSVQYPSL